MNQTLDQEPKSTSTSHNISVLPPDRYDELRPVFEEHGGQLPDPTTAIVLVSEDADGAIEAFWVVEAHVHIEPFWVAPEARNRTGFIVKDMLPHLLATLQDLQVKRFYTFAGDENMVEYMSRLGLQPLPYLIFSGLVPPLEK